MAETGNQQPHWPTQVKRPGDRRNVSRSATRALDVLECFGQQRRPLRAVEIARSLAMHPSTANQVLKTMVESAHLTFDAAAKTYLPSPRLARFGGWLIETYGGDECLRALIGKVQAFSGEVVTLTTPNDIYMQVVDLAGGQSEISESDAAERGLRVSMFGSAIGAAYLATLLEPEILRLAARARIPEDEYKALLEWMYRIRQDGFADAASAEGAVWSLAMALPPASQRAPLVIGLAGPADRIRPGRKALGRQLRAAVAEAIA